MRIPILLLLPVLLRAGTPQVRVEVFCDSTDKSCAFVRDEVIAPLAEEYGGSFAFRYHDTGTEAGLRYFTGTEAAYDDRFNSRPAVFISGRIIGGRTNIKKKLPSRVRHALAAGGSAWADTSRRPDAAAAAPGAAHVLIFYSPECGYCTEVKKNVLPDLQEKYGGRLFLHFYDVETSKGNAVLRNLEKKCGEPGNYIPVAYAAGRFLSGSTEVTERLDWWIGTVVGRGGCDVPDEAK